MKFCFVCGKKTDELIEGYCEDCYSKKFKLIEVPKEFSLVICRKCSKINHENKWEDSEIKELVKQKIKILGQDVEIKIERNDVLHVSAKGSFKDSKKLKEETYEIPLKLNKVLCPNCLKISGGYYEAVLQLRGNVTEETLDFVDEKIKSLKEFYRIKEVKNGFDLYTSNKSTANKIAKLLKDKFKADIKKSFKLITRKEGKDIYRNVILVSI
jgi:nonsense-mediated mRNA decay protein 3